MQRIPFYQVDSFTQTLFKGNPAGVCILDAWLPDVILQNIAMENNLSETAFVVRNADRFAIRWFTPNAEVDLCGHATLASAYVLFQELGYSEDTIYFDCERGPLLVHRNSGSMTLDFPLDPPSPIETPEIIRQALNCDIIETLKAREYLVIVKDELTLRNLQPNHELLKQLDVIGIIVSAPGDQYDFVSRCFYPKLSVPEDPVTGSAHCISMPYWAEKFDKDILTAEQVSARTGQLRCAIRGDRLLISGDAILYLKGQIILDNYK